MNTDTNVNLSEWYIEYLNWTVQWNSPEKSRKNCL